NNYGFSAGVSNLVGGLAAGAGILGAGVWKDSAGISTVVASTGAVTVLVGIVFSLVVLRRFHLELKPGIV
ncbi:MAG: hypothetical protein J2P21_28370, partial [Chloracidobacterium sp.]|nr:hypothetical protein [Chloracidobacterium sp.]